MWCQACRQDVPAAAAADRGYCCPRCRQPLERVPAPQHTAGLSSAALHGIDLQDLDRPNANQAPPEFDLWQLEQDIRRLHVGNRGGWASTAGSVPPASLPGLGALTDQTIAMRSPAMVPAPPVLIPRMSLEERRPRRAARSSPWLLRSLLLLGLLAAACGAGLMIAARALSHSGLWWPGMGTFAAGQLMLLAAGIVQLVHIARRSGETVERLTKLDQQLAALHHSTQLLGATRGTPGQAFYAHLAEGASPHILLADLKGQLDLLAVRLSDRQSSG